jgi:hypothetical protein
LTRPPAITPCHPNGPRPAPACRSRATRGPQGGARARGLSRPRGRARPRPSSGRGAPKQRAGGCHFSVAHDYSSRRPRLRSESTPAFGASVRASASFVQCSQRSAKPAALGRGQNRKVVTCKTIQQGKDFRDRMHCLGRFTLTKLTGIWLSKEMTQEIEERRATLRPIHRRAR